MFIRTKKLALMANKVVDQAEVIKKETRRL